MKARVMSFHSKLLGRYRGANANSVRVWLRSGGFFEAHRANELVEIVDDALVETVELGLLVGVYASIAFDRAEDAGGKGSVDPLEEFEEDQADRISAREQLIAPRAR